MAFHIDLPTIGGGSPEEQLRVLQSYLYQMVEQLNAVLNNLTVENMSEKTANALISVDASLGASAAPGVVSGGTGVSIGTGQTLEQKISDKMDTLRSLIVKTGSDIEHSIVTEGEPLNVKISETYVANSRFGDYLKDSLYDAAMSSEGFKQSFGNEDLVSRIDDQNAAISSVTNYTRSIQASVDLGLFTDPGEEKDYGLMVHKATELSDGDTGEVAVGDYTSTVGSRGLNIWNGSHKVATFNDSQAVIRKVTAISQWKIGTLLAREMSDGKVYFSFEDTDKNAGVS